MWVFEYLLGVFFGYLLRKLSSRFDIAISPNMISRTVFNILFSIVSSSRLLPFNNINLPYFRELVWRAT